MEGPPDVSASTAPQLSLPGPVCRGALPPSSLAAQLAFHGAATGLYELLPDGAVAFLAPEESVLALSPAVLPASPSPNASPSPSFVFCAPCRLLSSPTDFASHLVSCSHVDAKRRRGAAAASSFRLVVSFPLLDALPTTVVHKIFMLLPVDARLRCSEVCRAWRALIATPSVWEVIDLSVISGIQGICERPAYDKMIALALSALSKSGGQLRSLDVTFAPCISIHDFVSRAVCNAAMLTELRAYIPDESFHNERHVRQILSQCPLLRIFETSVNCGAPTARAMLRNEPPFGAMRVRHLWVRPDYSENFVGFNGPLGETYNFEAWNDADDVAALCSDLRGHTSLDALDLSYAPLDTADAMNAVADAAIALRLRYLTLNDCSCEDETVAALTRIVSSGFLRFLTIYNDGEDLFDDEEEDTHRFCDAVRAAASFGVEIFDVGSSAAIAALTPNTNAG